MDNTINQFPSDHPLPEGGQRRCYRTYTGPDTKLSSLNPEIIMDFEGFKIGDSCVFLSPVNRNVKIYIKINKIDLELGLIYVYVSQSLLGKVPISLPKKQVLSRGEFVTFTVDGVTYKAMYLADITVGLNNKPISYLYSFEPIPEDIEG